MNKIEIKLFLTFFIIFLYFSQWNDVWDFNSTLSLTMAIVNEGRFEIDNYHNITEVKSFYKGHYYNPNLGTSFLITCVYMLVSRIVTSNSVIELLMVVFTNSLFGALSCVLIYKILNFFTSKENYKLITTLSYGLCTSIFPYVLGLYVYIPAILFHLLIFLLLLEENSKNKKSLKTFFLAGVFAGISESIYPISILIILPILIYVYWVNKKMLPIFVLGCVISFSLSLAYVYVVLGYIDYSPIRIMRYLSGKGGSWKPPEVNHLKVLPRVLFYPWNGLFFYYPILFLSFLGVLFMFKKKKLECCIILIIFLSTWFYAAFNVRWWGDFSFGPRRFILAMPFLILGLPFTIEKLGLKIAPFFIISLFTNLLGLQMWLSLECVLPREINKTYFERVENFQILANPLKEKYFPNFLRNGPRSLLFENLIFNREISIRFGENIEYLKNYKIKLFSFPFGTGVLKTPFLSLLPLSIIIFFIWSKDIIQNERIKRFLDKKFLREAIITFLFLLLFYVFVEIT